MINRLTSFHLCALLLAAALAGCASTVEPLRPIHTEEYFVAATPPSPTSEPATAPTTLAATEPGTAPATLASTEPATTPATLASTEPATQPATQPAIQLMVKKIRIVDPNQTTRLVYHANYNRVWEQALQLVHDMGYRTDRQDFREGILTSVPNRSANVVEPWRPDQTGFESASENTVNSQQRTLRLTIHAVEGRAAYYEIAVQVLVERRSNPTESLGGPIFSTGSGFGHSPISLRSDYVPDISDPGVTAGAWLPIGHDTRLEKKILDHLFEKI